MRNPQRGAGRGAQHRRRDRHPSRASGRRRAQARPADRDPVASATQDQVLVFGKTKHGCNRLAEQLEKAGLKAVAIHGNKSQAQRLKALRRFQVGQGARAGRHRRRRARPRHPAAAAGDQLRPADGRRGLRAPHRPHRPRRRAGEAMSLVSPDEGGLLRADPARAEGRHRDDGGRRLRAAAVRSAWATTAPVTGRPSGQRPPSRRTPHTAAAPRHAQAHAGAKPHPAADRRERRAVNAPRPLR